MRLKSTDILRQQITKLEELLIVLQAEQSILINGNVKEIMRVTEEKGNLLEQLLQIENQRVRLLGDITLKDYGQNDEQDISDLIEGYQNLVPKISNLLEKNRLLSEMGYRHNTEMIEIITSSVKDKINTYGQKGKMNESDIKPAALLNRQV